MQSCKISTEYFWNILSILRRYVGKRNFVPTPIFKISNITRLMDSRSKSKIPKPKLFSITNETITSKEKKTVEKSRDITAVNIVYT